jgi:hypothetical protein
MGDPIIIWLPGTVYAGGACGDFASQQGWESPDRWYDCGMESDGSDGVYVSCCFAGG